MSLRSQLGKLDKAQQIALKGERCQNCNAHLTGPFCHMCGQKDNELRRPFWTFFEDFLDEVFSTDSRIVKTTAMMLLAPGALTKSFITGHRARYIPPIRFYLIVTTLFLVTLWISNVAIINLSLVYNAEKDAVFKAGLEEFVEEGNSADGKLDPKGEAPEDLAAEDNAKLLAEQGEAELEKALGDLDQAVEDMPEEAQQRVQDALERAKQEKGIINFSDDGRSFSLGPSGFPYDVDFGMFTTIGDREGVGLSDEHMAEIEKQLEQMENGNPQNQFGFMQDLIYGFLKSMEDPERLNDRINDKLPFTLFFLMPVFAVLLRMVHWRRDRYLFNQLVFSIHFHTFIYLMMTLMILIVPAFGGLAGGLVFGIGVPLYLLISLKVAQNQSWIRAFFKFLFISTVYFTIVFSAVMAVLVFSYAEV